MGLKPEKSLSAQGVPKPSFEALDDSADLDSGDLPGKLTVLIADDHQLIREAVKPYLRQLAPDVTVIEAANYDDVVAVAQMGDDPEQIPRIALIDLDMPGLHDDDMIRNMHEVCESLPNTAVVVFSGSDDVETIAAAIKGGAQGYIPKTVHGRSLVSALRLVLDGEIYVPLEAVRGLMAAPAVKGAVADPFGHLTAQERTSIRLLAAGMSNKEIARQMSLQVATVKMHLRNAYRKLGVVNRAGAVRFAVEYGLVKSSAPNS